jgi:hypothetical protein
MARHDAEDHRPNRADRESEKLHKQLLAARRERISKLTEAGKRDQAGNFIPTPEALDAHHRAHRTGPYANWTDDDWRNLLHPEGPDEEMRGRLDVVRAQIRAEIAALQAESVSETRA